MTRTLSPPANQATCVGNLRLAIVTVPYQHMALMRALVLLYSMPLPEHDAMPPNWPVW